MIGYLSHVSVTSNSLAKSGALLWRKCTFHHQTKLSHHPPPSDEAMEPFSINVEAFTWENSHIIQRDVIDDATALLCWILGVSCHQIHHRTSHHRSKCSRWDLWLGQLFDHDWSIALLRFIHDMWFYVCFGENSFVWHHNLFRGEQDTCSWVENVLCMKARAQ